EIYTLSLHDALPIWLSAARAGVPSQPRLRPSPSLSPREFYLTERGRRKPPGEPAAGRTRRRDGEPEQRYDAGRVRTLRRWAIGGPTTSEQKTTSRQLSRAL